MEFLKSACFLDINGRLFPSIVRQILVRVRLLFARNFFSWSFLGLVIFEFVRFFLKFILFSQESDLGHFNFLMRTETFEQSLSFYIKQLIELNIEEIKTQSLCLLPFEADRFTTAESFFSLPAWKELPSWSHNYTFLIVYCARNVHFLRVISDIVHLETK